MVESAHVHRVPEQFGSDLIDEDITAYADAANEMAEQFGALPSKTPSATRATAIGEVPTSSTRSDAASSCPPGPGHCGLDIGIKDNMAVAGVPMQCGSAAVSFRPPYHATVVDRFREAGAAVTATTNIDEFAYLTTGETCALGPTANPQVDNAVPGGSSSGSGAAVAAGLLNAALGSDTGGSIRIPASLCGVVGLKPTHRLVPRFGFAGLAPSLDCVGPLATDVATVARVLDTVSGPHLRDPSLTGRLEPPAATDGLDIDSQGYDIGVLDPAIAAADEVVAATVEDAVDGLTERGVTVESVSLSQFETATPAGLAVVGAEFAALALTDGQLVGTGTGHSEPWRAAVRSPELGENVREQILTNGALAEDGLDHYIAAQTLGAEFTALVEELLGGYDALVMPTTPMTAPEFGTVTTDEDFARTVATTVPLNLSGHLTLSVPAGTVDSAPVGVQFVGDRCDEATLVALGETLKEQLEA